jgi:hypothetical protein
MNAIEVATYHIDFSFWIRLKHKRLDEGYLVVKELLM